MSLFDDLNIEDFTSVSVPVVYKPFYLHKFKPEIFGFKSMDDSNVKYYRNMYGDVRYYLKKRYLLGSVDTWVFRIINKRNEMLHQEDIHDSEIKNIIPRFLRREVLKDFIDFLDE